MKEFRNPTSFQDALLSWYRMNRRPLPWRSTRDPYHILVSEIMLQQTQVETVIPYYHRFLAAFPTLQALADAPLDLVLKLWEGLGYYSRARNLHALAKIVVRDHAGRLPDTRQGLMQLPGIGPYSAGAVASIAFNRDCAVVDGNVQRVLARRLAWTRDFEKSSAKREIWAVADALVPAGRAGDYNQALMELGALVCLPQRPACAFCPIEQECLGRRRNLLGAIPRKGKPRTPPHFTIGAGVIWKAGKILIAQRPLNGLLGGLWEFPGGKRRPGESLPACVRREIREELDITVQVVKGIDKVRHAYSHFKITLCVFECRHLSGRPKALGCKAFRWVRPSDLKKFAFPAANRSTIERLLAVKTC